MKKMMLLVGLGLMATACGFKEDPLEDKNEVVRLATPPGSLKPELQGEDSDQLRIVTVDFKTFSEETSDTITFAAAAFSPEYQNHISTEVENLGDFPGSTYDSSTMTFSWKPPQGTVGAEFQRALALRFRVYARSSIVPDKVLTRAREVLVFVTKNPKAPEIVSVTSRSRELREGQNYSFEVRIKDPSAGTTTGQGPVVQILPSESAQVSLQAFVNLDSRFYDSRTTEWIYTYSLDLGKAEIVTSGAQGGFQVQAFNRYGTPSAIVPWTGLVFTSFGEPLSTWTGRLSFPIGHTTTIGFVIYDTTASAMLTATVESKPADAIVTCTQQAGTLACQMQWKPTGTPVDGEIGMLVTSKNQDYRDTQTLSRRMTFRYSAVTAAPLLSFGGSK